MSTEKISPVKLQKLWVRVFDSSTDQVHNFRLSSFGLCTLDFLFYDIHRQLSNWQVLLAGVSALSKRLVCFTMACYNDHPFEHVFPYNHLDDLSFSAALYEMSHWPITFDFDRLDTLVFNPVEHLSSAHFPSTNLDPD